MKRKEAKKIYEELQKKEFDETIKEEAKEFDQEEFSEKMQGVINEISEKSGISIEEMTEAMVGKGSVEHINPRIEPRNTLADNKRARELLGWEPQVTIEEGISELKKVFKL